MQERARACTSARVVSPAALGGPPPDHLRQPARSFRAGTLTAAPAMRVVGLTGGIATGKSTVSRELSVQGITVIDCDKLAHAATSKVNCCASESAGLSGWLNGEGDPHAQRPIVSVSAARDLLRCDGTPCRGHGAGSAWCRPSGGTYSPPRVSGRPGFTCRLHTGSLGLSQPPKARTAQLHRVCGHRHPPELVCLTGLRCAKPAAPVADHGRGTRAC